MNLESFTGPGSTPSRRRFWDKVTQAVIASQKVAGDNVTVSERQGAGTLINVNRVRGREGGVGACCYDDGTCDDLTEAECDAAEGNWQGSGTTCSDDPNPCLGACCEGEGGTSCVEDSTPDSCDADGGTFQDFGSTCDPDPCAVGGNCCTDGVCSTEASEFDCTLIGGVWFGDSSCDEMTCTMDLCGDCPEPPGCTNPVPDTWFYTSIEVVDGICYHCTTFAPPDCIFTEPNDCVDEHPPHVSWPEC